jgi:hypothetical protein
MVCPKIPLIISIENDWAEINNELNITFVDKEDLIKEIVQKNIER